MSSKEEEPGALVPDLSLHWPENARITLAMLCSHLAAAILRSRTTYPLHNESHVYYQEWVAGLTIALHIPEGPQRLALLSPLSSPLSSPSSSPTSSPSPGVAPSARNPRGLVVHEDQQPDEEVSHALHTLLHLTSQPGLTDPLEKTLSDMLLHLVAYTIGLFPTPTSPERKEYHYDARGRSLLRDLSSLLPLPPHLSLQGVEKLLSQRLFFQAAATTPTDPDHPSDPHLPIPEETVTSMTPEVDPASPSPTPQSLSTVHPQSEHSSSHSRYDPSRVDEAVKARGLSQRTRRWLLTGASVAGGATLLGLTGGLVAPVLAAGVGALGLGTAAGVLASSGGTLVVTSLFGLAGGGLAGLRVSRRLRGLPYFRLTPLPYPPDPSLPAIPPLHATLLLPGYMFPEEAVKGSARPMTPTHTSQNPSGAEKVKKDPKDDAPQWRLPTAPVNDDLERMKDDSNPSPQNRPIMHSVDSGKVYRVEYDTKVLLQLGTAFRAFVRDSAIRIAATEALRHTLVSGLVSALTWPMGLLKAGEIIIDPPWVLALERAKKAGLVLADVIASHAQGHRPISLIGYSTGALAIHTCLLELSKRGLYGHVDHGKE